MEHKKPLSQKYPDSCLTILAADNKIDIKLTVTIPQIRIWYLNYLLNFHVKVLGYPPWDQQKYAITNTYLPQPTCFISLCSLAVLEPAQRDPPASGWKACATTTHLPKNISFERWLQPHISLVHPPQSHSSSMTSFLNHVCLCMLYYKKTLQTWLSSTD